MKANSHIEGKGRKTIVTHSGSHHCDECMAIALLTRLPEFMEHDVLRSRDPDIIEKADVVVDVGGVYDAEKLRFDHHQRDFGEKFPGHNVSKMSSAGLVYLKFGKQLLEKCYKVSDANECEAIFQQLYVSLFQSIDAIDNGIAITDQPLYMITTDLSSRIGSLNCYSENSDESRMACFRKGVELARLELNDQINYLRRFWYPNRSVVLKAMENRLGFHDTGRIIFLTHSFDFSSHLYDLEQSFGISANLQLMKYKPQEAKDILYAIYPVEAEGQTTFRVKAVGIQNAHFVSRLSFPEYICGLRNEELYAATKIQNLVFVHSSGFLAGSTTIESAIKIANFAMEFSKCT